MHFRGSTPVEATVECSLKEEKNFWFGDWKKVEKKNNFNHQTGNFSLWRAFNWCLYLRCRCQGHAPHTQKVLLLSQPLTPTYRSGGISTSVITTHEMISREYFLNYSLISLFTLSMFVLDEENNPLVILPIKQFPPRDNFLLANLWLYDLCLFSPKT